MDWVVVAHEISCPTHVESSWSRGQTCVPCIGRQILNYWTVPLLFLIWKIFSQQNLWYLMSPNRMKLFLKKSYLGTSQGLLDFLGGKVKNLPAVGRPGFDLWVGKIPWRREWLPILVFLPGESHGQRRLVGCHPWDCGVRHDWATNTFTLHFLNWKPSDVKSWLIGKDSNTGKDRRQEKGVAEDEMVREHHWLSGHESEQTLGDSEGQRSLVCRSRDWKESDLTLVTKKTTKKATQWSRG